MISDRHKNLHEQKLPPNWLVNAINTFRTFLLRLNRKLVPANVFLSEQIQNCWLLPSLYVAARLDIATHLKDKPLTAQEISERLNVDAFNLSRILRALSSQGIFMQTRDGKYALNAIAKELLDEPGSLRYMILHTLGPSNWNLLSQLGYVVRTGKTAFVDRYGKEPYDYLADHPDEDAWLEIKMSNMSVRSLALILNAYDFSGFPLIAEIGGGDGILLANILARNAGVRGILFDSAIAIERAKAVLEQYHVEHLVEFVPGDFFQTSSPSAELYILKNIVHFWNDEKSLSLLENIGRVIPEHGRLIIIEMVVPTVNYASLAELVDIQMMAIGGQERTEDEFSALLEKSGFTLNRIIHTIGPISLIEAKKTG